MAVNAAGTSAPSNVATPAVPASTPVAGTTYLSDLTWASATVGYGTIHKDASIKGNPITLRGTTYAKGIGTRAVSQIAYTLAGGYASFAADVGVDDETNGQGAVDFQVLGDGKLLFDSGVLTGTSPVVHVAVSVVGVQTLTLVATNDVGGSIDYDHADCAHPQLTPASATALAAVVRPTVAHAAVIAVRAARSSLDATRLAGGPRRLGGHGSRTVEVTHAAGSGRRRHHGPVVPRADANWGDLRLAPAVIIAAVVAAE